jgi:hypothetical protein
MNFSFSKTSGNTWNDVTCVKIKEDNPHITSSRKISIGNINDLFQEHV